MMKKHVWRPGLATLLVLAGPWLMISTLMILAAFKNPGMWGAFCVSLGIASFFVVWIAAFKVEVDEKQLSYSSLLGGRRVIALDQIQSARLEIAGKGYRWRFLPLIRLTIVPKPDSGLKAIHINVKVLKRGAGKQIADAVSPDAS